MKQPSSTGADFSETKPETRGRKRLPGPPRQSQSFNLTDYELLELQLCDPSGKKNRNAGLRALIAASRNARAQATTIAPNRAFLDLPKPETIADRILRPIVQREFNSLLSKTGSQIPKIG